MRLERTVVCPFKSPSSSQYSSPCVGTGRRGCKGISFKCYSCWTGQYEYLDTSHIKDGDSAEMGLVVIVSLPNTNWLCAFCILCDRMPSPSDTFPGSSKDWILPPHDLLAWESHLKCKLLPHSKPCQGPPTSRFVQLGSSPRKWLS